MDRVIIGKAPANNEPYHLRSGRTGVFISRPSANVMECADGDLTFDTTAAGLLQIIARGTATIPMASDDKSTGNLIIQTSSYSPRGDRPVQIWWNSKSRSFANSITNLSFIEVGKNNSITTQNSLKNITGYALNCTTFIDDSDGTVAIKFDNASRQDDQYISYNVFSQSGYISDPEEYEYTFVFDIGDGLGGLGDLKGTGAGYTGFEIDVYEKEDGSTGYRYYTPVFPDDFYRRRNDNQDPFEGLRDVDNWNQGKINKKCHITLRIPAGVDISGKNFNNYLKLSTSTYPFPIIFDEGLLAAWGFDGHNQVTDTPTDSDFTAIASGDLHNIALKPNGSIAAWGRDQYNVITDTPAETGFIAISSGVYHNFALKADRSIVAWGFNNQNQVSDTPTGTGFKAVDGGYSHSIALAADGSIVSWGQNQYGQVTNTPTGTGFKAVAADGTYSIALRDDGSIVVWGHDYYNQATDAPTDSGYIAIAAGYHHGLALTADGSIVAWGRDDFGQVSGVPTGTGFTAIAGGRSHSIALKADKSIVAWGYNDQNQVSDAPAGTFYIAIVAGGRGGLALTGSRDDDPLAVGEQNTQEKDRRYDGSANPFGDVSKYATYGPIDVIGRAAYERESLVDPCIILNMSSAEWTPDALKGIKIVIENYGDIVGGGGYGSFGTMSSDQGKSGVSKPGGGGGGGAGHHLNKDNSISEYGYSRYLWRKRPDTYASLVSRKPGLGAEGFSGASGSVGYQFGYNSDYFGATGAHGGTDVGGVGGLANPFTTQGNINDSGWNPTPVSGRGSYNFWRWKGYSNADPDNIYWYLISTNQQIQYGVEGAIDYSEYFALQPNAGRPFVNLPWEEGPMIPGVSHYGIDPGEHGGYIYAGNGGSCIYLFANTTTATSGILIEVINKEGGRIMGGGGGGGGGHSAKGASGGDLGSPGSPGNNLINNNEMKLYGRYGEPGRIVWWNTPSDIQERYTIINLSSTSGTIKGLDGDVYFES